MIDSKQDEAVKLEACNCYRCTMELIEREPFVSNTAVGEFLGMIDPRTCRMFLCATCGNKRCPHAADHRNACTASNEPGQKGSLYEDAPVQPATPDKQEALAGEGVEAIDALNTAIELIQEAKGAEGPQGGFVTDHLDAAEAWLAKVLTTLAKPVIRTLPSNEALAGDDRNGVEDVAPDNLIEWLSGLADHFDSAGWPNRANGLRRAAIRLSRTQADEADVERVGRALYVEFIQHTEARVPREIWGHLARAALAPPPQAQEVEHG